MTLVVARVASAFAACMVLAGAVPAETIAIIGADIHSVASSGSVRDGTIVIVDGSVTAIGAGVGVPAGARVIDGTDKVVTPGLIDALGQLGLKEISLEASTVDFEQRGESIHAAFDITPAINPRSTLIGVARAEGVTHAVVAPESTVPDDPLIEVHPISGLGTIISLGDSTRYVVRARAAMFAQLGFEGGVLEGGSRARAFLTLDQALRDAAEYRDNRDAYERGETRPYGVGKADLDALVTVLDRDIPLVISVDRASDIAAAIELADRHRVRLIIAGAAEGWLVADKLAASRVPVIISPLNNLPESFDMLNASLANAARLHAAGVAVAITETETHRVGNLRQSAGNAVANGLPWIEGLRAITAVPADSFDMGEGIGTLQIGKPANLVVWDADPLEVTSFAETVFIDGREIPTRNRQRLLRDRYLDAVVERPRAYRTPDGR